MMIGKFTNGCKTRAGFRSDCARAHQQFLDIDSGCDAKQKELESCKCRQDVCEEHECSVEFEQCWIGCWDRYEIVIKEKECLENDRQMDWSATKKFECYVDILLHNYSKEKLFAAL